MLAFEVPGFGPSLPNARSRSLRALAQTLLAALDALGLDRFALVGASVDGRLCKREEAGGRRDVRGEALAWLVGEFVARKSDFVVSTTSTLLNP